MMANDNRVKQLLANISNPVMVKEAEQQLSTLSHEPLFLKNLQNIIQTVSIAQGIKLSATVVLSRTISNLYTEINQRLVAGIFLEILMDCQVAQKHKLALENGMVSFLEWCDQEHADSIYLFIGQLSKGLCQVRLSNATVSFQLPYLQEKTVIENPLQFYCCLRTLILLSKIFFSSTNQTSCNILALLQELIFPLISFIDLQFLSVSQNSLYEEQIQLIVETLLFLKEILHKFSYSSDKQMGEMLAYLCCNIKIHEWIFGIYKFKCTSINNYVQLQTENEKQKKMIIRLKEKATELHKSLMYFSYRQSAAMNTYVFDYNLGFIQPILDTIYLFAGYRLMEIQEITANLMSVLVTIHKERKECLQNYSKEIIHGICFPLIRMSDEEIEIYANEPQEFVAISEDCCDHQKLGFPKTQACKLLEAVGDTSSQIMSYIYGHLLYSLRVRLQITPLVSELPSPLEIQTSLLILTTFSYQLSRQQNLIDQIRQILNHPSCGKLNNLQYSRLYLFFAYNYVDVYEPISSGEQWVCKAMGDEETEVNKMMGLDFISNIAEQYYSESFMLRMAEKISKTKEDKKFAMNTLSKLLKCHLEEISEEALSKILMLIYNRIQIEIKMYDDKNKSNTNDIALSLHIYRMIESKPIYLSNKPAVIRQIWRVILDMDVFYRLHLEEELVRLLMGLIQCLEKVDPNFYEFVDQKIVPMYQKEKDRASLPYFLLFNMLIMKGEFQRLELIVKCLLESINLYFQQIANKNIAPRNKINIGNIIILLQNLSSIHGSQFQSKLILLLQNVCLPLVPPSDEPQDYTEPILRSRALNLLIILSIHSKQVDALKYLLAHQDSPLFKEYDLRVMVQCTIELLFRDSDPVSITQYINLMVKAIDSVKESTVFIKENHNRGNELKEPSTKIRIKKIEDYEHILRFIKTPFSSADSPEVQLKAAIEKMAKNNEHLYKSIINTLNTPIRVKLNEIMNKISIDGKMRQIKKIAGSKNNTTEIVNQGDFNKRDLINVMAEQDMEDEDDVTEEYMHKISVSEGALKFHEIGQSKRKHRNQMRGQREDF